MGIGGDKIRTMKKVMRKKILCEEAVGVSASIESSEVEMENENGLKGTIEVNERYELRYSVSHKIESKQYGRKISIQLLKLTENGKKPILRVDNSHDENNGSGKWPIHVHKPSGGRYMFIGATLEAVITHFIDQASKLLPKEDLEDLKSSIFKKLPFG